MGDGAIAQPGIRPTDLPISKEIIMQVRKELTRVCKLLNLPFIELVRVKTHGHYFAGYSIFREPEIAIQKGISDEDELQTLYHEIGHYFHNFYRKDFINADKFRKLFGVDSVVGYYLNFAIVEAAEKLTGLDVEFDENAEFISEYAQMHSAEDWAETFSFALRDFLTDRKMCYGNKELNKKVKFIKKCIRKAYDWDGSYED